MSEYDENDEFQVAEEEQPEVLEISQEEVSEAPAEDTDAWKARALKAEAILKRQKQKAEKAVETKEADTPKTDVTQTNQSEYLTRDEAILIAQGVDEEALAQLQAIAKGKGISLIEAKADPLFEAYQKEKREEKRKADAKLGASNSSGRTPKGKPISEMTREEHEAYWREKNGQ